MNDRPTVPAPEFFVSGGTLRHDALSYVERQADRDLYAGLCRGEFCYVLTARQMGKSSLMVRTASRLREQGIQVVALDLSAVGQNLTPEQWYDGLVVRMGRQLRLEDELEAYWLSHQRFAPLQRLLGATQQVILPKLAERAQAERGNAGAADTSHRGQATQASSTQRPTLGTLVVFIDEIDTVRSLPFSTDEFFAAIRECYNRRTADAEFNRLTFCLLGVATPADLIRDPRTTPFNIGRRIELNDFNDAEAAPLAQGLRRDPESAAILLRRVLYWTHGHPYLTQRLCLAIAGDPGIQGPAGVDRCCETLFLSSRARERDDNLLFVRERLLRSEIDRAGLLDLYVQIRKGKRISDDEANPAVSILRLSGLTRMVEGVLQVHNRIYYRAFDEAWVSASLPNQELLRERTAFRRGLIRAGIAAGIVLVIGAAMFLSTEDWRKMRRAQRLVQKLGTVCDRLNSYQDVSVARQEVVAQDLTVVRESAHSFRFVKPNKFKLVTTRIYSAREETQVICNGALLWVYRPALKQYRVQPAPKSLAALTLLGLGGDFGIQATLSTYGLLMSGDPSTTLANQAKNISLAGQEELAGKRAHILIWQPAVASPAAGGKPITPKAANQIQIPVKTWLEEKTGLILQQVFDPGPRFDPGTNATGGRLPRSTEFVGSIVHRDIQINARLPDHTFSFNPPADAQRVERFDP